MCFLSEMAWLSLALVNDKDYCADHTYSEEMASVMGMYFLGDECLLTNILMCVHANANGRIPLIACFRALCIDFLRRLCFKHSPDGNAFDVGRQMEEQDRVLPLAAFV